MKHLSIMGTYSLASNVLGAVTFQSTLVRWKESGDRRVHMVDEQITMQPLI